MSGSLSAVELQAIITASLNASNYVQGGKQVEAANASMQRSGEAVVGSQEKITRGAQNAARAYVDWKIKTDPLAKATVELANAQALLDRNLRLGLVTQEQHTQELAKAEARFKATAAAASTTANAFGVTARQAQQLAPQINDVVTSLLGGASAFQVLTQQGGQITQAMGGVGNTFRALAGLFTPMRVGVLAVGGAMVASLVAFESTERRVATLRGQLRGYTSDYEDLARVLDRQAKRQSESLPGVSGADVRTATGRLAQVITSDDRDNLSDYVRLTTDLARSLDTDLSGAISRVTKIIRSPAEAARDLAENGVRGFDEQFRRHIELMERAGDRAGATAEVIKRLREVVQGAAQDGSPLQRSLSDLSKEFESLWNTIKDGLAGPAAGFTSWLATVMRANRENGQAQQLPDGMSLFQVLTGRGGSTSAATPPAAIAPHLAEAARLTGLDPELLARVQRAEGRLNPDGSWASSSAGARGPMQLMPGTFAEVAQRYGIQGGIDDPRANTMAGAYYLRDRLQARGDVALALADYNAGPGRVDRVLAGQATLPDETARYVRGIRSGYSGTGLEAANSNAPFVSEYGSGPFASGGSTTGGQTAAQREFDQATRRMRDAGGPTVDRQNLEATLRQQQEMQAQTERGTTAWREWQDAIDKTKAALVGLETPVEKTIRQFRDQATVANTAEGFTRDLARAYQQLDETARSQRGTAATPEEQAAVRNALLAERSAGLRDLGAELTRQIEAETKLAEAQRGGVAAMQEQAAANRAREEVRKMGLQGTELEASAIESLTAKYRDLARAQQSSQVAGLLQTQQQQLQLARDELSSIGMSPAESARRNAEIQARGALEFRFGAGAADNASGQEYIRNAMQMADLRTQARYLNEIANYGREAASILVDGFRQFAFEGAKAKDVLKNMERALLDLGTRALVLKPLEQALGSLSVKLFGGATGGAGSSGGLGSLFSGVGNLFGGGTSAAAGAVAGNAVTPIGEAFAGSLVFHRGGIVGNDNAPVRMVPGGLFRGAPRFHTGGGYLARDEFPAILQMGERVLTQRQQAATVAAVKGGRNVTVIQNIKTDDPGAFNRSRDQIARGQARALQRASRSA
jgi:hypothetical protein